MDVLIDVDTGGVAGPPPAGATLVGGFDQLLTPALPIGYTTMPLEPAADIDARPPVVAQLALARLLDDGILDRAARRLSARCARGRAVLSTVLGRPLRHVAPGVSLLDLPGRDDEAVAATLRARGLLVATVRGYHGAAARPGLVLGYGHLPEACLRGAAEVLGETLLPTPS